MADTSPGSTASGSASSGGRPAGGAPRAAVPPGAVPPLGLWLWLHTLGRFGIAAVLIFLVWLTGVGIWAAALFGLLLSMPVAYVVLRPIRDRLAEAISARRVARTAAKQELRARLEGTETEA